jgi:hypothetical protein
MTMLQHFLRLLTATTLGLGVALSMAVGMAVSGA